MRKRVKDLKVADSAVAAKRERLVRKVTAIAAAAGSYPTAIPGLVLFRRNDHTPCYRAAYEPSLTVFLQGRKRISLGSEVYLCDGSSFILSSIDVPVKNQIVEASEKVPLLTMVLRLDMQTVREVLSRDDLPEMQDVSLRLGMAVGKTTAGLLDAFTRLIELLQTPEDIPFLNHLLQREIVYRILCTPQAGRLRAIVTVGNISHRAARAVTWLRTNYAKPLRIEELAGVARMGVSTLHHQFRALTAMSPLQYQKQLRLQTARQRMLMDGLDATNAAYEVGYESVSQFSREYSRYFGRPPMRDIKALKNGKVVAIDRA